VRTGQEVMGSIARSRPRGAARDRKTFVVAPTIAR
jgi:hypothetical protein